MPFLLNDTISVLVMFPKTIATDILRVVFPGHSKIIKILQKTLPCSL